MGRIAIATRAFFRSLFDAAVAEQVDRALSGLATPALPEPRIAPAAPASIAAPLLPKPPARSEALTLLATLQREARFVDFIQEKLEGYSDAQIGAAVRDIHRDSAAVLQRLFDLKPLADEGEGADVSLSAGFDAGKYRLTGNVTDQADVKGRLVHAGWEATRCELPIWTGSVAASRVVAPAEVEVS